MAKIWIEISKKAMGNEGLHTKKPHFFERNTIRIVFFCDSTTTSIAHKNSIFNFLKKEKVIFLMHSFHGGFTITVMRTGQMMYNISKFLGKYNFSQFIFYV